jgi:predicted DNA-binding transcriptional regulator YafY
MNRIDRLMGIVTLVQSKKHQGITQIAEHFDISERTVFRDLKSLGEIGIPIVFEPEKGYSIAGGFFLPPISLSIEEANALALLEPLAIRFAEKEVAQHVGAALAKIKMVLGRNQRDTLDQMQMQTAHYIPDNFAHMLPETRHLTAIQQAILKKCVVRIHYVNAQEEVTTRLVEPIGLTFYSLNWHLIGWCHLRQEYRDFRTSRIQQLTITLEPFRIKDHLTLHQYLAELGDGLQGSPGV